MPLPPKDGYTLSDLAERWKCPQRQVESYAEGRRLKLFARKLLVTYKSESCDFEISIVELSDDTSKKMLELVKKHDLYLLNSSENHTPFDDSPINTVMGDYIELSPEQLVQARANNYSTCVVTAAELLRFEEEHQINTCQEHPLHNNERDSLLKTIGALAELFSDAKGNKFKKPESINVSQVSSAIVNHLAKKGIDPTGMSKRSIEDRISTAIGILNNKQHTE